MKVHLMHRDRAFDPVGALARPDFRKHVPNGPTLSTDEQALVDDLGLNVLFEAMSNGDALVLDVARRSLLRACTNDRETILYRQEILRNFLDRPALANRIYCLSGDALEAPKGFWWGLSSQYPSSLLYSSIEQLELLFNRLRTLRDLFRDEGSALSAVGLLSLRSMLMGELSDDYLESVQGILRELRFKKGALLEAELGDMGESTGLSLRRNVDSIGNWLQQVFRKGPASYTFRLAERDETGAQIVSDMKDGGITAAAIALANSSDHIREFFSELRTEMAFYVGCCQLRRQLDERNCVTCNPSFVEGSSHKRQFEGLRELSLVLRSQQPVVGNRLEEDAKALVVITGANQGGKSTFLRCVGQAQLMMQAGMFVCANRFESHLCSAVFTYYKREEDRSMLHGKFDEELARLSDIADRLIPGSLLICNEPFSATNEREGSEIGGPIVRALVESGMELFLVTHNYSLAIAFLGRSDAIFLRPERLEDGSRTFRLAEGDPQGTSYGRDLYRLVFGQTEVPS